MRASGRFTAGPRFAISTRVARLALVAALLAPAAASARGCAHTTGRAPEPFNELSCVRRVSAAVFGGTPTVNSNTLQVTFPLVPPVAPSRPVATPGDSHVRLDWTSNDSGDQLYD